MPHDTTLRRGEPVAYDLIAIKSTGERRLIARYPNLRAVEVAAAYFRAMNATVVIEPVASIADAT